MAALASVVDDVASKLDVARTRKPELGAMAAVAAVILALGVQSLSPVNQRLSRLEQAEIDLHTAQIERAETVGQFDEFRENSLSRLSQIEERLDDMQGDRFTSEDSRWQALMDAIRESQEKHAHGPD
jgi:Na+-transporting NADH:ubiquinone oxidoreductase subunit NqrC